MTHIENALMKIQKLLRYGALSLPLLMGAAHAGVAVGGSKFWKDNDLN